MLDTVISTPEIIEICFLIVDIPTITEWIQLAQRSRLCTNGGQWLSPSVVLVFYYKISGVVNNANDITLKVVEVGVDRSIEIDLRRTLLLS